MQRPLAISSISFIALFVVTLAGCQRTDYRRRADRDVSVVLGQKTNRTPWRLPQDYRVYPDPRSRFFDPTATDCPQLPNPQPVLNGYTLPPLETGDPTQSVLLPDQESANESLGTTVETPQVQLAALLQEPSGQLAPPEDPPADPLRQDEKPTSPPGSNEADNEPVEMIDPGEAQAIEGDATEEDRGGLQIVPIPANAWQQLPESCLGRMLEFASVREEYVRTYNEPAPRGPDDIPRLTLANIMELALLNSRAYQTQKETLYANALRLTQQRYQYELRPTPFGNGTELDYTHSRVDGTTVNTLRVPSSVAVQRSLATGGQFLASFANNVVLTFNGPQGFSADVGSTLLFDFQQTIFQTDVRLESLTQAERDVVYAARDLVRFRRNLFRDLSSQYYNLLLSYRGIEIGSQDYFSNLRAFLQGRAEFTEAGKLPRVQVDQFEQNALRSRSDLVASCNGLETDLDRLKLAIGLPPEMPLNLSLVELETLSASDRLTVAEQLVQRTRRELRPEEGEREADITATLNAASVLTDRLLDIQELAAEAARYEQARQSTEDSDPEAVSPVTRRLQELAARLAALEVRSQVDEKRAALEQEIEGELEQSRALGGEDVAADSIAIQLRIYFRTMDVIESLLLLTENAIRAQQLTGEIAAESGADVDVDQAAIRDRTEQLRRLRATQQALDDRRVEAINTRELDELSEFVDEANELLSQSEQLASDASGWLVSAGREALRQVVEETVGTVLELSRRSATETDQVLPPIGVDVNDAMMTALVQRLDLMNQRAQLADGRRSVKIAADDLRSILDLRATQVIRTDPDRNRPFAFSFDDSETRLNLALDTPLNRRLQRNNYRLALIDYNRTIRNLIDAEDNVKFDVRQDLRQLRLRRDQYEISVASAALAYERVVSTRLQLQYEVGNVVARDFLEAQQAYTSALSSVARQHISYILGRIDLFFDLEGIQLDENGYWQGLENDDLQPPVNHDFRGTNPFPYDRLVPGFHYSDEIKATEQAGGPMFAK